MTPASLLALAGILLLGASGALHSFLPFYDTYAIMAALLGGVLVIAAMRHNRDDPWMTLDFIRCGTIITAAIVLAFLALGSFLSKEDPAHNMWPWLSGTILILFSIGFVVSFRSGRAPKIRGSKGRRRRRLSASA